MLSLGWRYHRYRVREKSVSEKDIYHLCNAVSESYKSASLSNPFSVYKQVVDFLSSNSGLRISRLEGLINTDDKKTSIALRHDMDADIATGIRAARYLAKKGVPGSFYLLHTSPYYGLLDGVVFYRYKGMRRLVRQFIATGCELGIHADPLYFYFKGINGMQALKTEIEWVRSQGSVVKGTVAHNSAAAYGAENFEIFRGKSAGGRRSLRMRGIRIPLQVLSERRLNLSYEGNFPIPAERLDENAVDQYLRLAEGDSVRNKEWLKMYFLDNPYFERGYDVDIWLLGRDAWVVAVRGKKRDIQWPLSTSRMLECLGSLENSLKVVISIHPEYVSLGG